MRIHVMFLKRLTTITLLLLLSFCLYCQPDYIWKYAKTGSAVTSSNMLTDSAGNAFIVGTFNHDTLEYQGKIIYALPDEESDKIFILKTDPMGRPIYLHAIHSLQMGANAEPLLFDVNNRGELAIIYSVHSTSSFRIRNTIVSVPSGSHSFIAKFSCTGYLLWNHELRVSSSEPGLVPGDLSLNEDGSVYSTGSFTDSTLTIGNRTIDGLSGSNMMYLTRINHLGGVLWLKSAQYGAGSGGISSLRLATTRNNRLYIGGYYYTGRTYTFGISVIGPSSGGNDAFLACYDTSGNALWAKAFTGQSDQYAQGLAVDNNNRVIFAGMYADSVQIEGTQYYSNPGTINLFLTGYSAQGDYIAATTIQVQHPFFPVEQKVFTLRADIDNNLIVCGEFFGPNVLSGIYELTNTDTGYRDIMFVKLNGTDFTPLWSVGGNSPNENYFNGSIDKKGNIYVAGLQIYGTLAIGTVTIPGDVNFGTPYLVKIDRYGNIEYAHTETNSADAQIRFEAVSSDIFGNMYAFGTFMGVNSAIGGINLDIAGDEGIYLARYTQVKTVSGTVLNQSADIVHEGYVKLIGYSFKQRSCINDSVTIQPDGRYYFIDVPLGYYVLYAVPTGVAAEIYVPSYFPSAEYWELADHIIVDPLFDVPNLVITVIDTVNFEGTAQLQGMVMEADSSDIMKSSLKVQGRPSQSATVVLAGDRSLKSSYEVVATTNTDAYGNFSFDNVDDGTYYLWVDIPGLPTVDQYIIDVVGGQFISNLNYLVGEEQVTKSGLPIYNGTKSDFDINDKEVLFYPVPASGSITVEINTGSLPQGILEVYDAKGACVGILELNSKINIVDISSYSSGTYIMRVTTNESTVHEMISIMNN